jgi:hypothetical protein
MVLSLAFALSSAGLATTSVSSSASQQGGPIVAEQMSCVTGVGSGGDGTNGTSAAALALSKGGNGCVVIEYLVDSTRTFATFNYTGATQSWTVPSGVEFVTFHLLGAGGGGALELAADGGAGGYARGGFQVSAGFEFEITVGQGGGGVARVVGTCPTKSGDYQFTPPTFGGGGSGGSCLGTHASVAYGYGSGGGRSAIRLGDASDDLATAGGGGGGGWTSGHGGAGGGITGSAGEAKPGGGGTQSGGGAGGHSGKPDQIGEAGTKFQGGNAFDESGGGGGGYFGGGGGGDNGGGGGGSSFVANLIAGFTQAGTGMTAGVVAPKTTSAPVIAATGGTINSTLANWTTNNETSQFQWQFSADGTNFSNVAGATSATLNPISQGGFYRLVETRFNLVGVASVNSNVINIPVPSISSVTTTTPAAVSSASAYSFIVTFSEPVTGFDLNAVQLTGTSGSLAGWDLTLTSLDGGRTY